MTALSIPFSTGERYKGAIMSACGRYRFALWRNWVFKLPVVVWIMLSPSTADAQFDDPTIRRCVSFSRTWGYGGIRVVNLYAYRATDPAEIVDLPEPHRVGAGNRDYLIQAFRAPETGIIVAAWGAHNLALSRVPDIMSILAGKEVYCLGRNKNGSPKHPLYCPCSSRLSVFGEDHDNPEGEP